ncbi:DUF6065 family protein [Rhizobium leguminosarum]|uniref:DUF6065 family protein n=1 Tax=Rhizobium leguminosarum TaxID=384 RepID=UPI0013B02846|nr:DUF6065 family protein [Rhizobium leguminosarum]
MKFEWFPLDASGVPPEVADRERGWMEDTPSRFAYRCLPLAVANQIGWVIRNERDADAVWDGGADIESVRVHCDGARHVSSHFGSGILTFTLSGLIRTEPGVGLLVTGPINLPKDAISPLTGWVETEWSPYTFTMNWKFTRKDTVVRFVAGEPIATIIPMSLDVMERQVPVVRDLAKEPLLAERHTAWAKSRTDFNESLPLPDSQASRLGWQKHYHQGRDTEGTPIATNHRTKIVLKPFTGR